jgi:hypothetical protein
MLDQGGATDGQAIVWNDGDGKWEAGTIEGSKWTGVTNGIYRDGRVAINKATIGTDGKLQVVQNSSETGIKIETNQTGFNRFPLNIVRGSTSLFRTFASGGFQSFINDGTDRGLVSFGFTDGAFQAITIFNSTPGTKRYEIRTDFSNEFFAIINNNRNNGTADPTLDKAADIGSQGIRTKNITGSTARFWRFGERKAGTVLLDTTQYITVEVDGTVYNLALATI